jgi:hypothetical protein
MISCQKEGICCPWKKLCIETCYRNS